MTMAISAWSAYALLMMFSILSHGLDGYGRMMVADQNTRIWWIFHFEMKSIISKNTWRRRQPNTGTDTSISAIIETDILSGRYLAFVAER